MRSAGRAAGTIRVGIGGWDYAPWRETFYPPKHPKAKQLDYASRQVTAIEVNATYFKLRSPDLFARWRDATPDGFKFAIKASRFCTNRKLLGEGREGIARFLGQGIAELGDKLGPILWQFMATKRFDPEDFAAFLALLPKVEAGVPLTHVLEPRHESFRTPAFVEMARAAGAGIVLADSPDYPCFDEVSGPVAYARLQDSRSDEPAGYAPERLDHWTECARGWAASGRDAYLFFIGGAKERAPAAAAALLERLR